MKLRISIIGLGWLGLPLAHYLNNKGHQVQGSYSNPERTEVCKRLPFTCKRIHFTEHKIEGNWDDFINDADVLILNIPPKRNTNEEIMLPKYVQHIVNHTPSTVAIICVSSTSVYGNTESNITEETVPQPITESGQAQLKAEQILQHHFKTNLTILRCSGLIGPNRHPGRFLAGRKNIKNPNGRVNVVHQTDCIQVITKVIEQHKYGQIFNLCSDQHPTRHLFYTKATELINLVPPHFISDSSTSIKQIDNSKSKSVLNHSYLTIEEALKQC